jgi:trafficking protein particle complex subunit 1
MQVTTLPMITHKVSIFLVYCASSLCLSFVSTMLTDVLTQIKRGSTSNQQPATSSHLELLKIAQSQLELLGTEPVKDHNSLTCLRDAMIFNLYIFNRKGKCLYYKEWNRPQNTLGHDDGEEKRLMFGMLYSLQELVGKMGGTSGTGNSGGGGGLQSYTTDSYTLNYYETGTGLRFVLNTDNKAGDLKGALRHLYGNIFVDYVVKHPSYKPKLGLPVQLPMFEQELERYIAGLACFS